MEKISKEILRVLDPGPLTSIQDLGRRGYRKFGVPLSGALDSFGISAANWLVGNHENQACLESTFQGPKLEVLSESLIAVTGAEVSISINGDPMKIWASVRVMPGDIIVFKPPTRGLRSYLAISGGIDCPVAMGSRSTCLAGRIGGLHGRALKSGDTIYGSSCASSGDFKVVPFDFRPQISASINLRAIPGPQNHHFDNMIGDFFCSHFKISSSSDRMGYRLEGHKIAFIKGMDSEILSEPCLPGNVQIPPDGRPIVLLNEQTVGGYPKIVTVISADIDRIVQGSPGDEVNFEMVSLECAHDILRTRKQRLAQLKTALLG